MNENAEKIRNVIFLLGIIFISLAATFAGIEKSERNECIEWQKMKEKYKATFYLTRAEAAQCLHYGFQDHWKIK